MQAAGLLLLLTLWIAFATAQDIATTLYPYIYTNLNNWPCVRLLNASGVIGCQAREGANGILYHAKSQEDVDNFISSPPSSSEKYSVVLGYHLLTRDNALALHHCGHVSGLIVLLRGALTDDQIASAPWSPDTTCPNCQYGLYANDPDQYVWNPQGQGLIEEAFDKPIFAINPVSGLPLQVYNQIMTSVSFNENASYTNYPLYGAGLESFMWAAVDSQTCLRRGWCEAVGGVSVFSTPSIDMSADDGKPVIVVASSLDSRSLFHDMTLGVGNDVSGMVAVLAIADTLSKVSGLSSLPKHIVYTLFSAESWGFAGSQRFVQDIIEPFQCTNASRAIPCPFSNTPCTNPCVRSLDFKRINFDNIETVIELNSLTNADNTGYWAHVDDVSLSGSLVNSLQQLSAVNNGSQILPAYSDGVQRKLPPSSAMSFLSQRRNIKAVVITDYQKELSRFYNSDLDDNPLVSRISQSICGVVKATSQAIYAEASGTNASLPVATNCTLVEALMDCLVSNFSCSYMQNYFNVSGVSRVSHYSSVFNFKNPQPQLLPRFAFSFLGGVTGVPRNDSSGQPVMCQTIGDCQSGEYCIEQRCVKTVTAYHDAYGTGLKYDESTGKVSIVDPTKGTWTESTWDAPVLRTYLVTSKTHQIVELVIGILWTLFSIAAVLFNRKYMKRAFKID